MSLLTLLLLMQGASVPVETPVPVEGVGGGGKQPPGRPKPQVRAKPHGRPKRRRVVEQVVALAPPDAPVAAIPEVPVAPAVAPLPKAPKPMPGKPVRVRVRKPVPVPVGKGLPGPSVEARVLELMAAPVPFTPPVPWSDDQDLDAITLLLLEVV